MASEDLFAQDAISPAAGSINAVPSHSIRGYSKDRAASLARMLSGKGLPSEAYVHPSGDGRYAIRAIDGKKVG